MQRRQQPTPHIFSDNIASAKAKLETQITKLKPGPERDAVLGKIRELDTAICLSDWLSSGLRHAKPDLPQRR
jgi:hypothetical protein